MLITKHFIDKTRDLPTPFVVYDLEEVKRKYQLIRDAFAGIHVHYSVKPNPHPRILKLLETLGSGFEVASIGETRQLLDIGVNPGRIICMHPIKSPAFLQLLQKHTVLVMAVDSFEEVDKIAAYAPDAKIVIRVSVDNHGSGWQLTGKFGVEVTHVTDLLRHIKNKGLVPYGLTFHVGSQCMDDANWLKALYICNDVWKQANEIGIRLVFLSLGGGLAVEYTTPVPTIEHIGTIVRTEITRSFNSGQRASVSIEPGRAMLASAGVLVTAVVGVAKRETRMWAYTEVGTYNGLVESIETSDRKFYPITVANGASEMVTYTIGGPTCVSLDTPFEGVELPKLAVGDRLYIQNTGAYVIPCAAPFNGFDIPREYFLEDL
jgi:ornithine decarboxylase